MKEEEDQHDQMLDTVEKAEMSGDVREWIQLMNVYGQKYPNRIPKEILVSKEFYDKLVHYQTINFGFQGVLVLCNRRVVHDGLKTLR